jgi:hypothetical protein
VNDTVVVSSTGGSGTGKGIAVGFAELLVAHELPSTGPLGPGLSYLELRGAQAAKLKRRIPAEPGCRSAALAGVTEEAKGRRSVVAGERLSLRIRPVGHGWRNASRPRIGHANPPA